MHMHAALLPISIGAKYAHYGHLIIKYYYYMCLIAFELWLIPYALDFLAAQLRITGIQPKDRLFHIEIGNDQPQGVNVFYARHFLLFILYHKSVKTHLKAAQLG